VKNVSYEIRKEKLHVSVRFGKPVLKAKEFGRGILSRLPQYIGTIT
jgi:hypothetical protein